MNVSVIVTYLKEVRLELDKVIWPKRKEVAKLTLTVVVISLIMAIYLGVLDYSFTKMMEFIISN